MQKLTKVKSSILRDNDSRSIDFLVLSAVLLLLAIGLIMVYSASIAYAARDNSIGGQYYYLIRHSIAVAIGVVMASFVFFVPTIFWQKNAPVIVIVVISLLILVLIPHIGHMVNGSKRWIGFGIINVQPSELAKLSIAIYTAYYASGRTLQLRNFRHDILPILLVILTYGVLLLLEPDMGSATVVFIIALCILFMADIDKRIIFGLLGSGAIAFIVLIIATPYRMRRLLGSFNPWEDALGKGYQLSHSLLAFGHGGWFGVGIGNSVEKFFYLPEAHTDFILAIIGEEFGAIGVVVVFSLFALIFYRGFNVIAVAAGKIHGRKFQCLLAQGISFWFFMQASINIGVCIGILPTKGLTLPFISYGGSSILVNCVAIAILLKIDYENKQKVKLLE